MQKHYKYERGHLKRGTELSMLLTVSRLHASATMVICPGHGSAGSLRWNLAWSTYPRQKRGTTTYWEFFWKHWWRAGRPVLPQATSRRSRTSGSSSWEWQRRSKPPERRSGIEQSMNDQRNRRVKWMRHSWWTNEWMRDKWINESN